MKAILLLITKGSHEKLFLVRPQRGGGGGMGMATFIFSQSKTKHTYLNVIFLWGEGWG